ncbi:MAG: hypothetical protein KDE19_24645 [Caldilineaceae bacterium]|nr:hypothetical protein [Caldilineaceae bacterium]
MTMIVHEIIWPDERIEHIAAHNITPEEFEEVCFGHSLILRAKATGKNPVYHVLGQTDAGIYLLCIVIRFPDGRGYPVTARLMNAKEERRYRSWKR